MVHSTMTSSLNLQMTPLHAGPVQASPESSRSHLSLVATLRRTTSRIFLHSIAAAAQDAVENTPRPTPESQQPEKEKPDFETVKTKSGWFSSTTKRRRHQGEDRALAESSQGSQDASHVEPEEEATVTTTTPSSSPTGEEAFSPFTDTTSTLSPSPMGSHRRFFSSSRLRLPSIPSPFRRRKVEENTDPSPRPSLSDSDSDKENFVATAGEQASPTLHLSDSSHSLTSFRSSLRQAVRGIFRIEVLDGKFSFSDDRRERSPPPSERQSPGRPPLRTLWAIHSTTLPDTSSPPSTPQPSPNWIQLTPASSTGVPPSLTSSSSSCSNSGSAGNKTFASALTHSSSSPDSLEAAWSPASSERPSQESEVVDENTKPVVATSPLDDESVSGPSMLVGGEDVSGAELQPVDGTERAWGDEVVSRMVEATVVRPVLSGHL
ncbi:hypothetical protein VTJ49DRAFT_4009 [Mycothermus thermophilus]|uniref:Uncharacterized protein n=1 Tax=Humicola insolens TaxID=85995 RepID=A0ABR3VMC1_HUMIN